MISPHYLEDCQHRPQRSDKQQPYSEDRTTPNPWTSGSRLNRDEKQQIRGTIGELIMFVSKQSFYPGWRKHQLKGLWTANSVNHTVLPFFFFFLGKPSLLLINYKDINPRSKHRCDSDFSHTWSDVILFQCEQSGQYIQTLLTVCTCNTTLKRETLYII